MAHKNHRVIVDGHNAGVQTNYAAKAQQQTENRSKQIGKCIFEGQVFRPMRPHRVEITVQPEFYSVGIN